MKTETKTPTIAPEDVRPGVWLIDEYGSLFDVKYLHAERSRKYPDVPFETHYFVCADMMNEIHFNLSDCRPIPLSADILQACGFIEVPQSTPELKMFRYIIPSEIKGLNPALFVMPGYYTSVMIEEVEFISEGVYKTQHSSMLRTCTGLHELQACLRAFGKYDLPINPAQLAEAVRKQQEGKG
jgi:hypothetical protein